MGRIRGWWLAALFLISLPAVAWQDPAPGAAGKLPDAAEIDSILRQLSEITGFRIRRHLPFQLITREQVNAYVKNQIRHTVRPKDIYAEELSLKKLGFVPPNFDLRQTTIDLLTEQAAAFYDFHQKKLFISDWAASTMRDEALVHELAHALADQNFNIEKYLNKDPTDAEESLARQTVVEGQASWLTIEFAARQAGKTLTDPAVARQYFQREPNEDDTSYPVFSQAPLYLRATMLFPYVEGEQFQQAVVTRDGQSAFSQVFTKPPVSTSQILHPSRYFAGTKPDLPELPKPSADMKPAVEGVFGEEDVEVLLRQYTTAAIASGLAPEMTGGHYRVDAERKAPKDSKDRRTSLVFATEWADESSATAFLNAYSTVIEKKWKRVDQGDQDATHISGHSEDGYYRVDRKGKMVLAREGFPDKL